MPPPGTTGLETPLWRPESAGYNPRDAAGSAAFAFTGIERMNVANGKQIRMEPGDSRDVGPLVIHLESITNGGGNFRVLAKDGGIPWETDPPPNLKYLTILAKPVP